MGVHFFFVVHVIRMDGVVNGVVTSVKLLALFRDRDLSEFELNETNVTQFLDFCETLATTVPPTVTTTTTVYKEPEEKKTEEEESEEEEEEESEDEDFPVWKGKADAPNGVTDKRSFMR